MTIAIAASVAAIIILGANPAAAVDPVYYEGNPSCEDLGYDFGFKVDPPESGTFTIPDTPYTITTDVATGGVYFNWASTLGLDAVIVKGGSNANVYVYDPPEESFGDKGLHSPINPNNNTPYGLSHMEFCFDYEVEVDKTAETTYTREYTWEIDKSVSPASWDFFVGDQGSSQYTVAVDQIVTEKDFAVMGDIVVANNTPFAATITTITDMMSGGIAGAIVCPVALPYTLPAGAELVCSYSADLPNRDDRVNTATVATEPDGIVGGGEATADVEFGEPTQIDGYPTVNVDDTNGASWSFSGDGIVQYDRVFDCSDVPQHNNTATIVETGQADSATVTIACYELAVSKTADTSVDRTYKWNVEKWAEDLNGNVVSELTLSPGQIFEVVYNVGVEIVGSEDSDFTVGGTITISNPAPINATILGVSDTLADAQGMNVDCGVTFPTTLVAGDQLPCTYTAMLPDGALRTNTANASLQNTPAGVTVFSGSATVDFSDPTLNDSIDECIDLSDTFTGPLGTVCFGEDMPVVFNYNHMIGPYFDPEDCGQQQVENVASTVTGDNGVADDSTWTITIDVPCGTGCTLTPGYWKTHSSYGPAPYDDTWAAIGEDTDFFYAELADGSIQSYYEVLWTPPQGGNAYYILAHAYIAAVLNGHNGASAPDEIGVVIDLATQWFDNPAHPPDYALGLKGKKGAEERAMLLMYAALLDAYNNGDIGPGHCSE